MRRVPGHVPATGAIAVTELPRAGRTARPVLARVIRAGGERGAVPVRAGDPAEIRAVARPDARDEERHRLWRLRGRLPGRGLHGENEVRARRNGEGESGQQETHENLFSEAIVDGTCCRRPD